MWGYEALEAKINGEKYSVEHSKACADVYKQLQVS